MELDRYDRAILRLLQQDARMTNARLASEVSLSESACLRRVRALEESGLIEGYTALINQQKAGLPGQRVREHHARPPEPVGPDGLRDRGAARFPKSWSAT